MPSNYTRNPLSFDLDRARQDTPGCHHQIHFNNAGASLMPTQVIKTVQSYFQFESLRGGYEAQRERKEQIQDVYHSLACLIQCSPNEVAIVDHATRGWNIILSAFPFKKGGIILTSASEYASNFISLLHLQTQKEIKIKVIPNDDRGQLSLVALEETLDSLKERVQLIAINHIPTNNGVVHPAQKVGKLAKRYGVAYLLDACQSIGQLPLSVKEYGCDFLSTTSRKFLRGPRGLGFLYVNQKYFQLLTPSHLDLRSAKWIDHEKYKIEEDARQFEMWEKNYAHVVGLGAAAEYALSWGLDSIWDQIQSRAQKLRMQLSSIPNIRICDEGEVQCGIITFQLKGWKAQALSQVLDDHGINTSVSDEEDALTDMKNRGLQSMVRASIHYYNSESEIKS